MGCSKCGKEWIVNKTYNLCDDCNQIRLHGQSRFSRRTSKVKPKSYTNIKPKKKFKTSRLKQLSKKAKDTIREDELIYEKVFYALPCSCQECGVKLPEEFRGDDGFIIARYQFSHIIPKSIAPDLRHVLKNFNKLCLKCHTQWDHGDKRNMKIYALNAKTFPEYLDK